MCVCVCAHNKTNRSRRIFNEIRGRSRRPVLQNAGCWKPRLRGARFLHRALQDAWRKRKRNRREWHEFCRWQHDDWDRETRFACIITVCRGSSRSDKPSYRQFSTSHTYTCERIRNQKLIRKYDLLDVGSARVILELKSIFYKV